MCNDILERPHQKLLTFDHRDAANFSHRFNTIVAFANCLKVQVSATYGRRTQPENVGSPGSVVPRGQIRPTILATLTRP